MPQPISGTYFCVGCYRSEVNTVGIYKNPTDRAKYLLDERITNQCNEQRQIKMENVADGRDIYRKLTSFISHFWEKKKTGNGYILKINDSK